MVTPARRVVEAFGDCDAMAEMYTDDVVWRLNHSLAPNIKGALVRTHWHQPENFASIHYSQCTESIVPTAYVSVSTKLLPPAHTNHCRPSIQAELYRCGCVGTLVSALFSSKPRAHLAPTENP